MGDEKEEKEPLHKNFFVRVVFVVICIIGLYYLMSPYQNCMRDYGGNNASKWNFCNKNSSW